MAADLVPGAVPSTTFGLITEALLRRRDRELPPFTIMSCDNIQGNGHVAATVFAAFARLRGSAWGDEGLGEWVQTHVPFPVCMVDRITPATTDQDRADIAARFGIADGWPVVCEPFTQWVLEDHFVDDRPLTGGRTGVRGTVGARGMLVVPPPIRRSRASPTAFVRLALACGP